MYPISKPMLNLIVIGYFMAIGVILFILNQKDKRETELSKKYLTEQTITIVGGIFLSVIVSLTISLNADIPDGYGLGGLLWIFGPVFFGAISILAYLIGLLLNRKLRIYGGLVCILFNIGVGIYYYQLVK